jgi:hypothetical protein
MGQKCCSDSNADKRIYDPSSEKISKVNTARYESNDFSKVQLKYETPHN